MPVLNNKVNLSMSSVTSYKKVSAEEYFVFEESNEIRQEFINGNLYEMSGASREHHQICKRLLFFFERLLATIGYKIFMENMKVKVPDESIYFYPDIIVTREPQTDKNRYAQFQPELITEVTSETTRTKYMIDK